MSSVVYFLYCSKQDCATYLDGVMLRSDPRLLRLSIQGLPTWSILVNRYSIPIYYSFHFRQFITTIVNIYILISLLWGFYDLYKNLPFVGAAMRRIFGPLLTWLDPLWRNRVVLLVPLLLNRLYLMSSNILFLFAPIAQYMLWLGTLLYQTVLSPVFSVVYYIGHALYYLIYPVIAVIRWLYVSVWSILSLVILIVTPLFQLVHVTVLGVVQVTKLLSVAVYALVKLPVQLLVMIYDLIVYGVSDLISRLQGLWFILWSIIQLIKAPFLYFQQFFTEGNTEAIKLMSDTVSSISNSAPVNVMSSAASSSSSSGYSFKEYFDTVKESMKPVSYIWTGIRRIIDSFLYTYNTKIKHHSLWMKRLLVGFLLVAILSVLILIFMLVL